MILLGFIQQIHTSAFRASLCHWRWYCICVYTGYNMTVLLKVLLYHDYCHTQATVWLCYWILHLKSYSVHSVTVSSVTFTELCWLYISFKQLSPCLLNPDGSLEHDFQSDAIMRSLFLRAHIWVTRGAKKTRLLKSSPHIKDNFRFFFHGVQGMRAQPVFHPDQYHVKTFQGSGAQVTEGGDPMLNSMISGHRKGALSTSKRSML